MLHEPIFNVIKRERKERRKKQEKENKRLRINVVEKVLSTMKKDSKLYNNRVEK